jgi:hypothetical protein
MFSSREAVRFGIRIEIYFGEFYIRVKFLAMQCARSSLGIQLEFLF